MTFFCKILRAAAAVMLLAGPVRVWAIHGNNAPAFFPVFFNSFNYAGTMSLLMEGTSCPRNTRLLPGTVPGAAMGLKFDLTARREALKTYLRGEFYDDGWGGFRAPLLLFGIQHQILEVQFGDIYRNIDPLLLYNRNVRGGSMKTGFEILDDLLKLEVQFRVGRSRGGADNGSPLAGYYNMADSLGVYPTNLGLFRIRLAEGRYDLFDVAFNFLHAEDYTRNVLVDSTLFPPRRSRLYGADVNYALPGGLADLRGRFYVSSLRENTNDAAATDDIYDRAVVLGADGSRGEYGYRSEYRYVGKNYYTGGNPYLETDRNGLLLGGKFTRPGLIQITAGTGYYRTNLDRHPRTPTGNVVSGRVRASLEKLKWPRAYLQLRLRSAWTDSVLAEVVDAGQEVFAEQFRRERSTTFNADLGGDMTLGKVWLAGWTGYVMYRDRSHNIFPVLLKPADADHWLLGLRSRWRAHSAFRLDNGLSVTLVRQEQAGEGFGLNETGVTVYGRGEYRPPLKNTVVRTGIEYLRQASALADRDYAYTAFSLAPRYYYGNYLSFELEYVLRHVTGRTAGYTANTLSLETVVLY